MSPNGIAGAMAEQRMNELQNSEIEDIEACAREGRRPRDTGPYRVRVGDPLFRYQEIIVADPIPTGRTLRELAEFQPPEQFVCFAVLASGLLEEVRVDETIDLRNGVEKFLAFKSDRIFRFTINGAEYQWGGTFITGATVLKLANLAAESHGVWLKQADGTERAIQNTELVDLAGTALEMFVTRPLS